MLDYQNTYVRRSSVMTLSQKVLNIFNGSTQLFLNGVSQQTCPFRV